MGGGGRGQGGDCTWDKENRAPNPSSKASALFPKMLELSLNQRTVQVEAVRKA